MLTRRQTLHALGAAGMAAPLLAACGGADSSENAGGASDASDLRLVKADVAPSAGDPSAVDGVVGSMAGFTLDLWHLLSAEDNLAISPYSIAVALGMTANGARGQTSRAMNEVLHVDSLATFNSGLAALTPELAGLAGPVEVDGKKGEIALAAANQLFGEQTFVWKAAFLGVLAKMYDAGMRTVDFAHAYEQARAQVNAWTAQQTHDRIPEILPPGSLDPTTRLVLVNALYFKAPWSSPFEKASTRPGRFHRADGSTVQAQLMSTIEGATSVSGRHFQGARLAYAGGTLAMTLALPTGTEEGALGELLADGLTRPDGDHLALTVPRWTYRVATGLKQPLKDLGMSIAFSDVADFRAMTDTAPLTIDDVLHQTFISVDEAGTEAAAATAVVMRETSGVFAAEKLVLDRPFLYVVHDTEHGTPLFVGRVADPS